MILILRLIHAECAIKAIPDEDSRNSARVIVTNKLNRTHENAKSTSHSVNIHKKETLALISIKEKLCLNNALLCKADKGNTAVLMYIDDYNTKVNDFIQGNGVIELKKDPTNNYQKTIRKLINNSKVLFSEEEIKRLRVMNPNAPMLRGLPKVHKEGTPIRPLVDYTSAPTYKLAQKLESILSQQIVLHNNYSLINTYDFINKAKNVQVNPHDLLVSFDIVNLFTNVPVDQTLDIVKDHLNKDSNLLPEAITELLTLLKEALKQNYFKFNDKYYSQPNGLAMGSPLSSLLANVYLNHIENKYIFSDLNKQKNKITEYHRYVDDTILIFKGNTRQLDLLHKFLNNITPNLKFTMETEQSNKINFLDITIEKIDNRLDFSIYRKPTTSNQTIHSTSYHPVSHKLAAYNSMVYRLLHVPMTEQNYNRELKIIKQIAVSNGYDIQMVDNLVKKYKNKQNQNQNLTPQNKKFVCVDYSHHLHHSLKNELEKHGIKLAFRTSNKVINKLKPKINRNKADQSGVYKIKCASCPSTYIGKTGRSFSIRYKEHRPNGKTDKQKSTFAQHLVDNNHDLLDLDNGLEILHACINGNRLDTLEEYEIYKAHKIKNSNEPILNDQLQFKSHTIFNNIIKRSKPQTRDQSPADNTATAGTN